MTLVSSFPTVPANDNRRGLRRRLPAIVDIGVDVFAGLLTHLERRGSITAADFSDLVHRRCRDERSGRVIGPDAERLLKIVADLSPMIDPNRRTIVLLGKGDDGIS